MSINKEVETVTITVKEYEHLLERDDWLSWLECAGVDNTEAWDYACEMKRESDESEKFGYNGEYE